jgi:signal transduction histidine kinase
VGIENTQARPTSHGLKIMRERAEAFGGSVTVGMAPKKGTLVEARIPIQTIPPVTSIKKSNGSVDL